MFENYIVSECFKKQAHRKTHSKLYYYRTSHGVEIDLIIDHRQYKECIEIKTNETFHPKMTQAIEKCSEPNDKAYLIYRGKDRTYLENVKVVNFETYFS